MASRSRRIALKSGSRLPRSQAQLQRKQNGIPDKVKSSIQESLTANRKAQAKILEALQLVAKQKMENRRKAAQCIQQIRLHWDAIDDEENEEGIDMEQQQNISLVQWKYMFPQSGKRYSKTPPTGNAASLAVTSRTSKEGDDNNDSDSHSNIHRSSNKNGWQQPPPQRQEQQQEEVPGAVTRVSYIRRHLFRYDPDRKWTRTFFVDPAGSMPAPNKDFIRRQQLIRESFFHHLSPPFMPKEDDLIRAVVRDVFASNTDDIADDDNSGSLQDGVDDVWNRFHARMIESVAQFNRGKKPATKISERSMEEYRMRYQFITMDPTPKLNKQESLLMLEMVHMAEARKEQNRRNEKSGEGADANLTLVYPQSQSRVDKERRNVNDSQRHCVLDWEQVAESINRLRASSPPTAGTQAEPEIHEESKGKLTAWDCLHAYETQLKPIHADWTIEEDRVMLATMAALGPQHVLDFHGVMTVSAMLGHTKNIKQILARINQSLLNPSLDHSQWNKDDQRRLTLCMKAYKNDPSPTLKANLYHFPNRNPTMVSAKWNRSLNPDINSCAGFTEAEDELVRRTILERREKKKTQAIEPIRWTQYAREYFPNRSVYQVKTRWLDMAEPGDLMETYEKAALSTRLKKDQDILSAEDFVVQTVPMNIDTNMNMDVDVHVGGTHGGGGSGGKKNGSSNHHGDNSDSTSDVNGDTRTKKKQKKQKL